MYNIRHGIGDADLQHFSGFHDSELLEWYGNELVEHLQFVNTTIINV